MKRFYFFIVLFLIIINSCAQIQSRDTTADAIVFFDQGEEYAEQGDYSRAINAFTQAIRLNPNYTWAYIQRGQIYLFLRSYDNAITDFSDAIRTNPNERWGYYYRARTYSAMQNLERSIEDSSQAIRIDPTFTEAYRIRANMYYSMGVKTRTNDNVWFDRALNDYGIILRLVPNDPFSTRMIDTIINTRGWR